MKKFLSLVALLAAPAISHASLETISTTVNILIPDGSLAGMTSQIDVSGFDNQSIADVTVGLDVSGTANGDLYAYLEHDGDIVVLLNRVGVTPTDSLGYADQGMNVTFADGAPNIHYYRDTLGNPSGVISPLTGTWAPDGRAVSPDQVNGTETPTTSLSSFIGDGADGEWTLFVADASGGDLNTLNSWSLSFEAVPEPANFGLVAGVCLLVVAVVGRSKRVTLAKNF